MLNLPRLKTQTLAGDCSKCRIEKTLQHSVVL